MPSQILTDQFVRALRPESDAQRDYWDKNVTGLVLRVSPAGKKTWSVLYRFLGRQRRYTLGCYAILGLADARREAKSVLHSAALGRDPVEERQRARSAETFEDLAREYMEKHAKVRKKSWKHDERILFGSPQKKKTRKTPHVAVAKVWGQRKLADIKRRDVLALVEAVARRGPIMANRVLACVRKVFNFAIERDWLEANPCQRVPRPAREHARDRVLTEDEIRAVWQALDHEQAIIAAAFRVRLLTAQRGGEVLGARWSEMDLTTAWWTIPAERSKNRLAHRVPLSPPALRILKELKLITGGSEFVFPSPSRAGQPIQHAQKAIERVVAKSGVSFRGHDLRRTAASLMVGSGVSRLVVSKILNHVETGVTAVYDRHGYDIEKRGALNAWGARVERILAEEGSQQSAA